MQQVLAESIEAGGLGLLHHPQPHPLRRRRPAGGVALGDHRGAARPVRGRRPARGHHPRGHDRRLPRPLQRRRDRAVRRPCRPPPSARSTGTCSPSTPRSPVASPASSAPATVAAERGGRIVALTMPVLVPMNMSFLNHCALFLIPGLGRRSCGLPRARADRQAAGPRGPGASCWSGPRRDEAGVFERLADFDNYVIGDTYSEANEGLKGRRVGDIAAERGADAVRHADRHRGRRRAAHRAVAHPARRRRRLVGAAPPDVGRRPGHARRLRRRRPPRPHVRRARSPPASSATASAAASWCPLERAVQLMTQVPAELFGLRDRGVLRRGRPRRPRGVRPRDGRRRARHPGPRPARRLAPPHRRRHRRAPGATSTARSRSVDNQATGALPRHRAPQRPRHRDRRHPLTHRGGPAPGEPVSRSG